ncbi:type II toxin-antitoxin system PemK/MazF family toxin [Anaerophaga thermohalophila]|jgi:hypothetical protein|uniref:type II toxin-antitoxin system PemK/MazF family toxin n=1 Tax=Anaerophaga thermohalophila TaxID=177400 RepID=UPI0002E0425A|nr:type II toxin-antitoxin system PemK/MazF family toxin [Anaerophaga thermohalophila]
MILHQRCIVEVPFNLPQGVINHPAIILSNDTAIQEEGGFVAVMLTSEESYQDEFTFEITKGMTTKKLDVPYCQARVHLISFFRNDDVIPNKNYNNYLKENEFQNLIQQIVEIAFGYEY